LNDACPLPGFGSFQSPREISNRHTDHGGGTNLWWRSWGRISLTTSPLTVGVRLQINQGEDGAFVATDTLDGNHPFAGRRLLFDVQPAEIL